MTDEEFTETFMRVMNDPFLSRDAIVIIGELHLRLRNAERELRDND